MKLRSGFVSNSSSSSFLCDVCGDISSGWDLCLSEAGMYECTQGHCFCEGHVKELEPQEYIKMGNEQIKENMKGHEESLKQYQDKVDSGLGDEKEKYSSYTNAGYVEYYAKKLEGDKEDLEKLVSFDITSEDFELWELKEFVEEEVFGGDFRYSFPEELCPVCQENKRLIEQKEESSKDPDWETYVTLYNKFDGISPKVGT